MGIIALEGLQFHGYHGVHEGERQNGNSFEIDVHLETDFDKAATTDDLAQTIDYEEVYGLVREQLKGSHYLLEHLADKIMIALYGRYQHLQKATVKVSKLNPPVGGPCHKASVTLTR